MAQCLLLPLQFKFTDSNRVALFHTSLAQGVFHAERCHDLLEPAHGAIMFPVCHGGCALDGRTRDAPFIRTFTLDNELARVFLGPIDWHLRFELFEWGRL